MCVLIFQKWFWTSWLDTKHGKGVRTAQRHCHTQGGSTENEIQTHGRMPEWPMQPHKCAWNLIMKTLLRHTGILVLIKKFLLILAEVSCILEKLL